MAGTQETLVSRISATLASAQDASPTPSTGPDQRPAGSKQNLKTSTEDLQETVLSENLKDVFSHASNIIQECIEVERTIFLDASIGTFGGYVDESNNRLGQSESIEGQSQESIISNSEEEHWETPTGDTDTSEGSPVYSYPSQLPKKTLNERWAGKKKMCRILGFSTEENSSLEGDKASEQYAPVVEAFLYRLLYKYPHRQVFNLDKGSLVISSMNDIQHTVGDVTKAKYRSSEKNF
jgi:hypothetical protein